jgi:hypothetical protein
MCVTGLVHVLQTEHDIHAMWTRGCEFTSFLLVYVYQGSCPCVTDRTSYIHAMWTGDVVNTKFVKGLAHMSVQHLVKHLVNTVYLNLYFE